jgi:hypothetical protein
MLKLKNGNWLIAYTVSTNQGYKKDVKGGLQLEIAESKDNCGHWKKIGQISDPGRDLDNAQMIETKDGNILLACGSVRWQESYILPVYKSSDKGKSWILFSAIDETHGKPGELGKPDKGIYEPHFHYLNDGRLSVMYANEKHVVENPSYSQVISQKISEDNGSTWGKEIWVAYEEGHNLSRPGMPVWTKMKNGKFIVVYEICGPEDCNIYYKKSNDGISWPVGLGTLIPEQLGGPYVLSLADGTLVLTSNKSNISISEDYGNTWHITNQAWAQTLWPSVYEITPGKVAVVNSVKRREGGHNVQIKTGLIVPSKK